MRPMGLGDMQPARQLQQLPSCEQNASAAAAADARRVAREGVREAAESIFCSSPILLMR